MKNLTNSNSDKESPNKPEKLYTKIKVPYNIIPKNLMSSIKLSVFFMASLWSIFPLLLLFGYALTYMQTLLLFLIIVTSNFVCFIINSKLLTKHLNQLFNETFSNEERYHEAQNLLISKEKRLSDLLEQAPIGIFYYDKNLQILRHNTMFKKLFGLKKDLKAFNLHNIEDNQAIKVLKHVINTPSEKETIGSFNFSFTTKPIWVELTCSSLLNDHNEIIGGIGTIEDKSTEHLAYEKINYISLHDPLTALPNRRSYQEYMQNLIAKVEHTDYYSFLFYMDLNRFKQINDTFGHIVGDKLLLEVAQRFKSLNVKKKYLSRIGGDEFIMIVPFYTRDSIIAKGKAKDISLKIKALFNEAFHIEGLDLFMTTSIGIVLVEPNSNNTEQIIRQADMAMYQTKREGLNNIRFYDQSLDIKQQELTSLQHDLKDAIDNNELELYYQPIVSMTNNSLNAIEALIRWNHPRKGMVMPDKFLPMATESGLITKVGWWVAQEVCNQLQQWKEAKIINFEYISVNINSRQLNEVNFVEKLDKCIKRRGINPSLLKLELTETTLLDNFDKTQNIIQRLKANGTECSIDGFGTGYSSLSYLKKFAFKVLKIDKVFTKDILTNKDNQELVKSIIAIGKQFNYKIIIEGVETEQQREEIMEIDNSIYYQGFLCSRPIPAKEFERKFLTYVYHI
ncbi:MAG: diguanylate cyclase/phosphodiesterase (GGDEF & EAL domains) with PAS/PAC sensor(s) [uncultured Sulfurovum sp.]|uniref:Diguanylate cyclase/phosphodiesterase (GGDEF & EAL domains) with PAS/PAC sensor(S) n=1 Tax=uncultured Sulfurovum sp. TaxID=269237 RepID=A0A6S6TI95_9BACT|nr:MAG: diguanylate cyclase/phosphodiesterase (GGDEF & EAL domains) with PAS/PAC sensor(s) [uncultured Sulfurovum sp.]